MVVPLYFEESPALSGVSPFGIAGASLSSNWNRSGASRFTSLLGVSTVSE